MGCKRGSAADVELNVDMGSQKKNYYQAKSFRLR